MHKCQERTIQGEGEGGEWVALHDSCAADRYTRNLGPKSTDDYWPLGIKESKWKRERDKSRDFQPAVYSHETFCKQAIACSTTGSINPWCPWCTLYWLISTFILTHSHPPNSHIQFTSNSIIHSILRWSNACRHQPFVSHCSVQVFIIHEPGFVSIFIYFYFCRFELRPFSHISHTVGLTNLE